MAAATRAAAADGCEGCTLGALEQRVDEHERRLAELEQSLRRDGGIFDTLRRLELELATFVTKVASSVRVASAIGSAVGAIVGALFAAGVAVLLSMAKG
jgi:exosome complex RNA-binding protein Rrp42 (RNase PH superfamily)